MSTAKEFGEEHGDMMGEKLAAETARDRGARARQSFPASPIGTRRPPARAASCASG